MQCGWMSLQLKSALRIQFPAPIRWFAFWMCRSLLVRRILAKGCCVLVKEQSVIEFGLIQSLLCRSLALDRRFRNWGEIHVTKFLTVHPFQCKIVICIEESLKQ